MKRTTFSSDRFSPPHNDTQLEEDAHPNYLIYSFFIMNSLNPNTACTNTIHEMLHQACQTRYWGESTILISKITYEQVHIFVPWPLDIQLYIIPKHGPRPLFALFSLWYNSQLYKFSCIIQCCSLYFLPFIASNHSQRPTLDEAN